MAENGHTDDGNPVKVELIIRASRIDGKRKGVCLFCQEFFMELYLLAEMKFITLIVTTVDMQKPPPDFRSNFDATTPPILMYNEEVVLENEAIERHIMKYVPGGHNLFIQNKQVNDMLAPLYNKFKLFLTMRDKKTRDSLMSQLKEINDYLVRNETRFLTGDTMSCFDCELMPRLQHIRVVTDALCPDFEIPHDFTGLWTYMSNMYKLEAFIQSCPADQDIINHIKMVLNQKIGINELTPPVCTTHVPTDAQLMLLKTTNDDDDLSP